MSKVFVDADIILDILCTREPFYESSAKIFSLGDLGKIKLFTSALVFANIFYILRKNLGIEKAKELLRKLRLLVSVLPIGEKIVDLALNSDFSDFEDGIQYFTARQNNIGVILTRNIRDYKERDITIQTPQEFLKVS